MTTKILDLVKEALGLSNETGFDPELTVFINSVFLSFEQIGSRAGDVVFSLVTGDETWTDYDADITRHGALAALMFLKVKSVFDPTGSATVAAAYAEQIKELEFRLGIVNDEE